MSDAMSDAMSEIMSELLLPLDAPPPTFSVVIPAYNAAEFIGECLHSVLAQSDPDFEVIVVDDGSTDATAALVRSFTDPRVCLVQRSNGGLAAARNSGIRAARGELVAFLDADDRWCPGKLAAHRRALAADPAAAVSYDWSTFIDRAGRPTGLPMSRRRRRLTHEALMVKNYLGNGSTAVVRRSVLEAVGGFDEHLRRLVDHELWVRLAHAGHRFRLVPAVLTEYRIHPGSLSADTERMLRGVEAFLAKVATFAPASVARLSPLVWASTHRWMARAAFVAGDYGRARAHARQALSACPAVLWRDPRAAVTFAAIALEMVTPRALFQPLRRLGQWVVTRNFRQASALLLVGLLVGEPLGAADVPAGDGPVELNLAAGGDYLLGTGDRVRVVVYGHDDLSGEQLVVGDGRIVLPLAGAVRIGGLTPEDATAEITHRLAPFVNRPAVSLSLVAPRPLRISVSGEVNQPGPQVLTNPATPQAQTLSLALVAAGGITRFADLAALELHRRLPDGSTQVQKLDLWQNLIGKARLVDPLLHDGDYIVVPKLTAVDRGQHLALRSSLAPQVVKVAVGGHVHSPGMVTLSADRSVFDALLAAGGPLDGADLAHVTLYRQSDGQLEVKTLDLDAARTGNPEHNPPLLPGDSLMVPKTGFQSFIDGLANFFRPVASAANLRFFFPRP